jgi:ferredoxin--NADP+ reductase
VLGADAKPVPGEYVVGWAKRGPTGLIGTNRADSVATVRALLEDAAAWKLEASPERTPEAAEAMLARHKPDLVRFDDWKRLDAAELDAGKRLGKIREKFSRLTDMLAALGKVSSES